MMVESSAANYMAAPFANKPPSEAIVSQGKHNSLSSSRELAQTSAHSMAGITPQTDFNSIYRLNMISPSSPTSSRVQMMHQAQYPPQPSSTGSVSPHSNVSSSVSPAVFPSPPYTSNTQSDLSSGYTWNAYTGLPGRSQFHYHQYASEYYGNMGMSSAGPWFSQDRLYQTWPSNSYGFNFEDIAFQTQLQRRSVRCTCPNCTNEMSGLPPIVGPDERGRKQHICHIPGCERLYGKASHLKTHLRWHTGERPFLCLTCGKRFSRSDELQRHGRTHTNYRPYSCPHCVKKFSRSDHLSKHKKTHFKDKKTKKVEKESTKKEDESKSCSTSASAAAEPEKKVQSRAVNHQPQFDASSMPNNSFMKTEPSSTSHNEVPSGYSYIYPSTTLFHNSQSMGLYPNRTADSTISVQTQNSKSSSLSSSNSLNHQQNGQFDRTEPESQDMVGQGVMPSQYDTLHLNQGCYPAMGQHKPEFIYPEFSSNPAISSNYHHWPNYHSQMN